MMFSHYYRIVSLGEIIEIKDVTETLPGYKLLIDPETV